MGKKKYQSLEEMAEVCRIAKLKAKENAHRRAEKIKQTSNLPYSFTYKIRNAFIGKICPVCGRPMGKSKRDESGIVFTTSFPSIQHNIPIAKGGTDTIDNISVICRSCNSRIRDKITGDLNNAEVRKVWTEINEFHKTRPKTSKLGMER